MSAYAYAYALVEPALRIENSFTMSSCETFLLFSSTDVQTQIGVVVVVSIAVVSILTGVLVVIFFIKGTTKPRAR